MKMQMYAVHDMKAEMYMRPFCADSLAIAVRSFENEVKEPGAPLNKNPEDYNLFKVGEYDSETGVITPCVTPQHVISAMSVYTKYFTVKE